MTHIHWRDANIEVETRLSLCQRDAALLKWRHSSLVLPRRELWEEMRPLKWRRGLHGSVKREAHSLGVLPHVWRSWKDTDTEVEIQLSLCWRDANLTSWTDVAFLKCESRVLSMLTRVCRWSISRYGSRISADHYVYKKTVVFLRVIIRLFFFSLNSVSKV